MKICNHPVRKSRSACHQMHYIPRFHSITTFNDMEKSDPHAICLAQCVRQLKQAPIGPKQSRKYVDEISVCLTTKKCSKVLYLQFIKMNNLHRIVVGKRKAKAVHTMDITMLETNGGRVSTVLLCGFVPRFCSVFCNLVESDMSSEMDI